jgi:hypothetical protein
MSFAAWSLACSLATLLPPAPDPPTVPSRIRPCAPVLVVTSSVQLARYCATLFGCYPKLLPAPIKVTRLSVYIPSMTDFVAWCRMLSPRL